MLDINKTIITFVIFARLTFAFLSPSVIAFSTSLQSYERQKLNVFSTSEDATGREQQDAEEEPKWAYPVDKVGTGCVLLAADGLFSDGPQQYFDHSVIFLFEHSPEAGSAGLILNRPTPFTMGEIIRTDGLRGLPGLENNVLYLGGDVGGSRRADGLDVVNLMHNREDIEGAHEVIPGVYMGGLEGALKALSEAQDQTSTDTSQTSPNEIPERPPKASDFKFFTRFAGWAPGQLDKEVESGVWYACYVDAPTVTDQYHAKIPTAGQGSVWLSDLIAAAEAMAEEDIKSVEDRVDKIAGPGLGSTGSSSSTSGSSSGGGTSSGSGGSSANTGSMLRENPFQELGRPGPQGGGTDGSTTADEGAGGEEKKEADNSTSEGQNDNENDEEDADYEDNEDGDEDEDEAEDEDEEVNRLLKRASDELSPLQRAGAETQPFGLWLDILDRMGGEYADIAQRARTTRIGPGRATAAGTGAGAGMAQGGLAGPGMGGGAGMFGDSGGFFGKDGDQGGFRGGDK